MGEGYPRIPRKIEPSRILMIPQLVRCWEPLVLIPKISPQNKNNNSKRNQRLCLVIASLENNHDIDFTVALIDLGPATLSVRFCLLFDWSMKGFHN